MCSHQWCSRGGTNDSQTVVSTCTYLQPSYLQSYCKYDVCRYVQDIYLVCRNQVLGMIRRNITYKEKSLIVPLYKAIVRPH